MAGAMTDAQIATAIHGGAQGGQQLPSPQTSEVPTVSLTEGVTQEE